MIYGVVTYLYLVLLPSVDWTPAQVMMVSMLERAESTGNHHHCSQHTSTPEIRSSRTPHIE